MDQPSEEKQDQLLDEVAAEWTQIATATGPADRAAAWAAAQQAYQATGLPPPEMAIWADSPLSGALAAATLVGLNNGVGSDGAFAGLIGAYRGREVRDRLWAEVSREVRHAAPPPHNHPALATIRRSFEQVAEPIGLHGADELAHGVTPGRLAERAARSVSAKLSWTDLNDLDTEVMVAPTRIVERASLTEAVRLFAHACYGQHDANWLAYFDGLRRLGVPGCDRLSGLIGLAKQVGWWWPFERVVVLTERPTALHRDEQGWLHNADGPAVAYADGWQLHAWHGTRVQPALITGPLTPGDWDTTRFPGDAQVIAERVGYAALLDHAIAGHGYAVQVAVDAYGTLWRLRAPVGEDVVLVEVRNSTPEPDGSYRRYVLRVPPRYGHHPGWIEVTSLGDPAPQHIAEGPQPRPVDAIGWTFGLAPGMYRPAVMT